MQVGLVTLPASCAPAENGRVDGFESAAANLGYLRDHMYRNGVEQLMYVGQIH